jgi:hypothetical protein
MREYLRRLFVEQEQIQTKSEFTEKFGRSCRIDYDLYSRVLKARSNNHMDFIKARTNQLMFHNANTVTA